MDDKEREDFAKPISPDRLRRFMFEDVAVVRPEDVIPHGSRQRRIAAPRTKPDEPPESPDEA